MKAEFEHKVLKVIQAYYPVSWKELRQVYDLLKSFDKTVKAIESALRIGESFISQAQKYE